MDGKVKSDVVAAIPPALASFIATRDRRIAKDQPWSPTPISELFGNLLRNGRVVVGGRHSCGPRRDPSLTLFSAWNEVVAKAKTAGLSITVTPIKHGNGWATKAGGFWDENEYVLASQERAQ